VKTPVSIQVVANQERQQKDRFFLAGENQQKEWWRRKPRSKWRNGNGNANAN